MTAFDFSSTEEEKNFWLEAAKRVFDVREALSKPPPKLDFVVPGLLAGTVGAVVSQGGVGKSNLALMLAAGVASGLDLLGFQRTSPDWKPAKPERVVFLTAEDPPEILAHRMHSLASIIHRIVGNVDDARDAIGCLEDNLEIWPLVGMLPNLMNEVQTEELRPLVRGSRLIVVDTLRRFHRLPEADDGGMAQLVGTLETLTQDEESKPALLYLHHVNKTSSREGGAADQTASRGSSVLVDNSRFQLNLVNMTPAEAKAAGLSEDERKHYLRAVRSKANYSAPLPDIWYRRDVGGMLWPADTPAIAPGSDGNSYEAAKSGEPFKEWPQAKRRPTAKGVNGEAW